MKLFIGLFTFLTTLLSFARVIIFIGAIVWLCVDPYGLGNVIGSFIAAVAAPILNLF